MFRHIILKFICNKSMTNRNMKKIKERRVRVKVNLLFTVLRTVDNQTGSFPNLRFSSTWTFSVIFICRSDGLPSADLSESMNWGSLYWCVLCNLSMFGHCLTITRSNDNSAWLDDRALGPDVWQSCVCCWRVARRHCGRCFSPLVD